MICHDARSPPSPSCVQTRRRRGRLALENERLDAELRARVEELRARGRGSSRPPTTSAAGSSATSTTAPSSGWSRSRSTCAWRLEARHRPGEAQAAARRGRRRARRGDRPSCASSPAASTRRCSPTAGSARRSRRSPGARRCRSSSASRPAERLPAPVESASYFVVAEALTNVARYARATHAEVSVAGRNGRSRSRCATTASAAPTRTPGSGLRGLADRVAALDGRLEVDSPRGGGPRSAR